ncbi:hypothetical protein HT031_004843 [Scenedesmus sp. PABB004]|nr:hypothetical protein HT031_004843 [Scenedesmus sp. PABB004]
MAPADNKGQPIRIINGTYEGDRFRPYLPAINASVRDTKGRAFPGNPAAASGGQVTRCNAEGATLRVRITDSCPCTQVLAGGAPGVAAGGETRTQAWCCAASVFGVAMVEFRPVDCDSGAVLPASPGYIDRWFPYLSKDFILADVAATPQPPAAVAAQVPPLKLVLQKQEARAFCKGEPALRDARPSATAPGGWARLRVPLASFDCPGGGLAPGDATQLEVQNGQHTPEQLAHLAEQHASSSNHIHLAAVVTHLGQLQRRGALIDAGSQAAAHALLQRLEPLLLQPAHLQACGCRQLSNVVWACGVCGYSGPLLTTCLSRFLERLKVADNPHKVCMVLTGAASAGMRLAPGSVQALLDALVVLHPAHLTALITDSASAERLAQLVEQHASSLNHIHLAAVVTQLGQLQRRGALNNAGSQAAAHALLQRLELLLLQPARLRVYGCWELSNVVWACGVCGHSGPLLAACLSRFLERLLEQLETADSPHQASMVLTGAASAGMLLAPDSVQALLDVLVSQQASAKPQDLSSALWAVAAMGHAVPAEQLRQLLDALVSQLPAATSQDLSNALWAAAVMGQAVPAAQLGQLEAALAIQPALASLAQLADALWACSELGHQPALLLAALAQQQGRLLPGFEAVPMAIAAQPCAQLGHRDEQLLGGVLQEAVAQLQTKAPEASGGGGGGGSGWRPQQLCTLCWAAAVLDLRQCADQVAVLARAAAQQWGRVTFAERWRLQQVHLWAADCGLRLGGEAGGAGLAGVLAPQQLEACGAAWAASLKAARLRGASQLQHAVFETLWQLPFSWRQPLAMQQAAEPDGAWLVDIAAVTADGARLAVQVDGGAAGEAGESLSRDRALAARGYEVVRVRAQDWAQLRGDQEQRRWLAGRVASALL